MFLPDKGELIMSGLRSGSHDINITILLLKGVRLQLSRAQSCMLIGLGKPVASMV